jgi:hypothetical protein
MLSSDGKLCAEKDITALKVAGEKLEDAGQRRKVKGGPAAIRTAERPRNDGWVEHLRRRSVHARRPMEHTLSMAS